MHDIDFIVPGALVEAPLAPELMRDLELPNLTRIARHASESVNLDHDDNASLAPWQAWVFGTHAQTGFEDADINLAELWAMACGLPQVHGGSGRWLAEPAHFRIAQDHLRLDDPHGLAIMMEEARALSTSIAPLLAEAGWRLEPVEPSTRTHWFLLRDDAFDLTGAALDRAIGENVAHWQPRAARSRVVERVDSHPHPGPGSSPGQALLPSRGKEESAAFADNDEPALAWRRCVNEIQMLWFGHPVNEAREARGVATINTLWLSGNGAAATPMPHYRAVDSTLELLAALAIEPDATRVLESFDGLIAPARIQDWATWRSSLAALDARLGEVLDSQRAGQLGRVCLALFGADGGRVLRVEPRDLGKFWRGWGAGASLADLFSDNLAGQQ